MIKISQHDQEDGGLFLFLLDANFGDKDRWTMFQGQDHAIQVCQEQCF